MPVLWRRCLGRKNKNRKKNLRVIGGVRLKIDRFRVLRVRETAHGHLSASAGPGRAHKSRPAVAADFHMSGLENQIGTRPRTSRPPRPTGSSLRLVIYFFCFFFVPDSIFHTSLRPPVPPVVNRRARRQARLYCKSNFSDENENFRSNRTRRRNGNVPEAHTHDRISTYTLFRTRFPIRQQPGWSGSVLVSFVRLFFLRNKRF